MTQWFGSNESQEGRIQTIELDGMDYRVRLHGHWNGEEIWCSEFKDRNGWSRIGATLRSSDEAKADVIEFAAHLREKGALHRPERYFDEGRGTSTPWGRAQHAISYAPGITSYSCAGHGGFKLSAGRLAEAPEPLRNRDGWYEEDAEWAKVAVAFPDFFTVRERRHADQTLKNYSPDAWEAVTGHVLKEGESQKRDAALFRERHVNDWVVIAASLTKDNDAVVAIASVGGIRGDGVETKEFLVPAGEYGKRGPHGFSVDLSRHPEIGIGVEDAPGLRR